MDDYLAGRTDGLDIADYIIAWHEDDTIPTFPAQQGYVDLATYLGMTAEQYQTWFYHHTLPERGAP